MKYIRTIEEFNSISGIRGIYEGLHAGNTKVIARLNNKIYVISHMLNKPELNEVRDDVAIDFLKQIND